MRTLLFATVFFFTTSAFAQQVELKDTPSPKQASTSLKTKEIKASAAMDLAWDRMLKTVEAKALTGDLTAQRISVPLREGKRVTEERSLNVSVRVTEQAIGGVVNVTIQVLPSFSGIGVVDRPIQSFSYAEAVETLDAATIQEAIKTAGQELLRQERLVVVEDAR